MQTASRISEEERRPPRVGPETRVSRTLTLRQWCVLQAAAKLVAGDFQRIANPPSPRWWQPRAQWKRFRGRWGHNRIACEQFAECAAELVRAVHELERQ